MTGWADVIAQRAGVVHMPAYTLYSVCGTAVGWNVGYPYDLGDALETAGLVEHQPISYGKDGVPYAFPMETSIQTGVAELRRQIALRDPADPKAFVGYSQGAIVTSIVYEQMRNTDDELHPHFATFLGGVTFGNPRREEGHTIPGGIDPGGHGIVTPNMVNTPDSWWDFADGKAMVNSPGNDLYTTCGSGTSAATVADQEAVWAIVDTGSFSSFLGLAEKILAILPSPITGGLAAIEAAINALDFFVVEGITPHTSYQFVQPIVGNPRDCWATALDYLWALAYQVPATPTPVTPQPEVETLMTTPATTPAATTTTTSALDELTVVKSEIKTAVDGLLTGLTFVQKFGSLIPSAYVGVIDTAVKVLTLVNGLL